MKSRIAMIAACALAMLPAQAQAALLNFKLTGSNYNASWQLDSQPTTSFANFLAFGIDNVAGTYNGVAGSRFITFRGSFFSGGVAFSSAGPNPVFEFATQGTPVFAGSPFTPTFAPGTFSLANAGGSDPYTLVIEQAAAAVPEPASWAMMITGFGLVGVAMRRRRPAARRAFA